MIILNERWAAVSGWESLYEVSSFGRVRSAAGRVARYVRKGQDWERPVPSKVLTPYPDADGYLRVKFSRPRDTGDGTEVVRPKIHVMVCIAFHGPKPNDRQAAHGDGDKTNNTSENLRWATPAANTRDKYAHGTMAFGQAVHNATLTEDLVRKIRAAVGSLPMVAAQFGISKQQASRIRLRQRWGWVT